MNKRELIKALEQLDTDDETEVCIMDRGGFFIYNIGEIRIIDIFKHGQGLRQEIELHCG